MIVTRGFADLLRIGDQRRPELFARAIVRPEPLAEDVIEVDERIAADGSVVRPLEEAEIARVVGAVRDAGADAVAVALVHAWRDPGHERRIAVDEHDAIERALLFDVIRVLEQIFLIGVRAEAVQHEDLGIDLLHHAEDFHFRPPLDEPATERVRRLIPDDQHGVLLVAHAGFQVMEHAAGLAHAARADDDGRPIRRAHGLRVFFVRDVAQIFEVEG